MKHSYQPYWEAFLVPLSKWNIEANPMSSSLNK